MGREEWADLDINVRILRNFKKWIYAVHERVCAKMFQTW
jgi:hypothetical protein